VMFKMELSYGTDKYVQCLYQQYINSYCTVHGSLLFLKAL